MHNHTFPRAQTTQFTGTPVGFSELDYIAANLEHHRQQLQLQNNTYNNNYPDYGCAEPQLDDAIDLAATGSSRSAMQSSKMAGEAAVAEGPHRHQQQQIDNISYSYCDNSALQPDVNQLRAASRARVELASAAAAQAKRMQLQQMEAQRRERLILENDIGGDDDEDEVSGYLLRTIVVRLGCWVSGISFWELFETFPGCTRTFLKHVCCILNLSRFTFQMSIIRSIRISVSQYGENVHLTNVQFILDWNESVFAFLRVFLIFIQFCTISGFSSRRRRFDQRIANFNITRY